MNRILKLSALMMIGLISIHCSDDTVSGGGVGGETETMPARGEQIEASEQREGNAAEGWNYLINGDYVSSGIPQEIFKLQFPDVQENLLRRSGDNALLAPEFTTVTHPNGVKMVSPNCLTCHSDKVNGEFIVGLGNTSFDYSTDMSAVVPLLNLGVTAFYGADSDEWRAFEPFSKATAAVNDNIVMAARGVNPADQLTAVLVAHRDPQTLEWKDTPDLEIPSTTIPTDVPAWWLLKKKNAMFYSGIGRGDFSKFLMASSLLTLEGTDEAAEIDQHFVDVLAWINSLEAPAYPAAIDQELAAEGKQLFELNCSSCHGTYGADESYPNLLIPTATVGTDATLVEAYSEQTFGTFVDWYNESWFAQGEYPGKIVPGQGYVAPPLDGIWATAPYLHNGSVPTLEALLDSSSRPTYWERSFDNTDYDLQKVGWNYEDRDSKLSSQTYDTTLRGYGNGGHIFGDRFTDGERAAVIEYMKGL